MSHFKRDQRKYVKKAYRVRNWCEYEAGLRNRGSLTVWISLIQGKLENWDAPRPKRRKPGRQRKYSNHAIETAVTLGQVFHLASRQSEGLLRSLLSLLNLDNDVPDHTTISRRKAKLGKVSFYGSKQKTPLHILIDSSGLTVHVGQLRKPPKSRDYRKLHFCVEERTGEMGRSTCSTADGGLQKSRRHLLYGLGVHAIVNSPARILAFINIRYALVEPAFRVIFEIGSIQIERENVLHR